MSASSLCLRCFRQSLRLTENAMLGNASSSSVPARSYATAKKTASGTMTKSLNLRRKKGVVAKSTGKPPAPGERKAMRKRIVLSSTSAIPIEGLQALKKQDVENARAAEGKMLGFQDETIDALRAIDGFRPSQAWGMYHRPSTMIRPETGKLFDLVTIASREAPAKDRTFRMILSGAGGAGKSVLQLQAMAAAQTKGWVLVHIPEAQDLAIGRTAYQPHRREDSKIVYIQPDYTKQLLGKIAKANAVILSKLQMAQEHKFDVPVQKNITLGRLLELGASDVNLAYPVWQAFLKEITTPSKGDAELQRPPVMITIDGLHHIMADSKYITPERKPIHAQDLALADDVCGYLSGRSTLGNGGIVLAATAASNRPPTPTFDYLIASKLASKSGDFKPEWDAFTSPDNKVQQAVGDADVMHVGGVGKREAKGLMEYYALSGLMRTTIANDLVGEKWSLSGGGIIGALERACVLDRV